MMHDQLARLVPVEAHRTAHRALREHRFALLLGEAGSGKSSIAASLALGAMDQYGARPIKIASIEDLQDRWNPREPDQFFWLDDGFGATQYERSEEHTSELQSLMRISYAVFCLKKKKKKRQK